MVREIRVKIKIMITIRIKSAQLPLTPGVDGGHQNPYAGAVFRSDRQNRPEGRLCPA